MIFGSHASRAVPDTMAWPDTMTQGDNIDSLDSQKMQMSSMIIMIYTK